MTKGINVDAISHQLPANLQLEIHIHLNKKMVEQVRIFTGCPKDFFNVLVTKLAPCICIAGDYVFYAGDTGKRMYFVKRGALEVVVAERVMKTLNEGDYFGEMALLLSEPRTADIRAVCDCMLLSLGKDDLDKVLQTFPAARLRIEHAVKERQRELEAIAKDKQNSPSSGNVLRRSFTSASFRRKSLMEAGGSPGGSGMAPAAHQRPARRRISTRKSLESDTPSNNTVTACSSPLAGGGSFHTRTDSPNSTSRGDSPAVPPRPPEGGTPPKG